MLIYKGLLLNLVYRRWIFGRSFGDVLNLGSVLAKILNFVGNIFFINLVKKFKYFYKVSKNGVYFLFSNFLVYRTFLSWIWWNKSNFSIYFFKVFVKGLGYEVWRLSKGLVQIFMGFNHYYYVYIPRGVYLRLKKRSLFFLSLNKAILNKLFWDLLFLKRLELFAKKEKLYGIMSNKRVNFLIPKKVVSGYF